MRRLLVLASVSLPLLAAPAETPEAAAAKVPPPTAAKAPVTDTYHGVAVADDYRWLEDGAAPDVKAWSEAQNAHARAFLDRIPGIDALRAEIAHLVTARPAQIGGFVHRAGKYFAVRFDPAKKQQPWIVLLASLASTDGMRTLVDPNEIDPAGGTAFDWYVPSTDGTKLAVSLSQGGSEAGTLHVYDVASGKETGDVIPGVQNGTGGGSLAWNADSTGFWYTRYPREGERPKEDLDFYQSVFFHRLGTKDSEDAPSLVEGLPRIAETTLRAGDDGRRHLALVANGDGGDFAVFHLPEGATAWKRVSDFSDGLVSARFGRDGAIWAISKKGAPRRRVVRIPGENPALSTAKVIVPEGDEVIEAIAVTDGRLYTAACKRSRRTASFSGRPASSTPSPASSSTRPQRASRGRSSPRRLSPTSRTPRSSRRPQSRRTGRACRCSSCRGKGPGATGRTP